MLPVSIERLLMRGVRTLPFWRGRWRLHNIVDRHVVPSSGIRRVAIHGCPLTLRLDDRVQRDMYEGVYEPTETEAVRRYLRRGMTVVDVGAHIGYYTALAATRVGPTGRVFAFEPSDHGFNCVADAMKGLTHVDIRQTAVGSGSGSLRLWINQSGPFNPSLYRYHADMDAVAVPVTTLDQELPAVGTVDLLKIDVEGHEMHVLAGARDTLARTRAILCEFNERLLNLAGESIASLHAALRRNGFHDAQGSPPIDFDTRLLIRL